MTYSGRERSTTPGRRNTDSARIDQLRHGEATWRRVDSPAVSPAVSVSTTISTTTTIVPTVSTPPADAVRPIFPRPPISPNSKVNIRPGNIINVAHIGRFVQNGAKHSPAEVQEFKDAEGTSIGSAIGKKRYMVVLKVDEEHLVCLPIFSHNKSGVETLSDRARWCHVPMEFNTSTGVDQPENLTGWPPIRYCMRGSHKQMDGKSFVWLPTVYAYRFGKDETVERLGEVLPNDFRKLKDIYKQYMEDE